ncbi:MAG: hypothetical protein KDA21_02275 [Phycisphaerales bacterium]|nr:hypothetical protein [Phycisphaerales bacterium]
MSRTRNLTVSALLLLSGIASVQAGFAPEREEQAGHIAPDASHFRPTNVELIPPAWLDTPAADSPVGRDALVSDGRPRETLPSDFGAGRAGGGTNHRGRNVAAARIPFFDDFEHRTIGASWRVDGMTRSELSSFAGPFATEPQFLDLETQEQMGYIVEFDLYLLAPGDAGCTFDIEADGVVLYQESFAALGELAELNGAGQVPVVRGARMGFIATSGITELTFTSTGDAGQLWGIDNVRIEIDPTLTLSEMGEDAAGGGGGMDSASPHKSKSHRKPGARVRANRGGRGGSSGGVTPPDFSDLFDDDPVDEPVLDDTSVSDPGTPSTPSTPDRRPPIGDNPTQGTTPEDPMPPDGPDAPAPGSATMLLLGGAAFMRRRR